MTEKWDLVRKDSMAPRVVFWTVKVRARAWLLLSNGNYSEGTGPFTGLNWNTDCKPARRSSRLNF